MNTLLLSDWLPLCARAAIPAVPASFGPAVRLDDIQRAVEGLGKTPTLDAASAWLAAHCRPPATMWRWDCCASADLKEAMTDGHGHGAPAIDLDLDDPRLMAVLHLLERGGASAVRVLVRPWVRARREGGLPVELRAFVSPKGVAISSYYTAAPLPSRYLSVAAEARSLAERLAAVTPVPAFSADFLLQEDGTLVFLEGGPGFDRRGLVDACWFDPAPVPGETRLGPMGSQEPDASAMGETPKPPPPAEGGPKVGIFWLHGRRLVVFTEDAASVRPVAGVRDSQFGHDEEWPHVQAMHPELAESEYFDIPRGRVLHRPEEGVFDIFLPVRLLRDRRVVTAIARAFGLPTASIRLRTDEHYEPS